MSIPSSERRPWTHLEDNILTQIVANYTADHQSIIRWADVVDQLNLRCYKEKIFYKSAKQCRERWTNCLQPGLKSKEGWTTSQAKKLFHDYQLYGHKWSKIAQRLPGRSENAVKNYFYSAIRKTVRKINQQISKHNSNIKNQQKAMKMAQIAKEKNEFEQKTQIKKLLKPLTDRSISKLLILAEQKQQYKFQLRKDLQFDHICQLKAIFLQIMMSNIGQQQSPLYEQESDNHQQQQQSDQDQDQDSSQKDNIVQNCGKRIIKQINNNKNNNNNNNNYQFSDQFLDLTSYSRLNYFLQCINEINKICKKKNYRSYILGRLSTQQSQKMIKDKKKRDNKKQKMVKKQLKTQGYCIIPQTKRVNQIYQNIEGKSHSNKYPNFRHYQSNNLTVKRGRPRKQQCAYQPKMPKRSEDEDEYTIDLKNKKIKLNENQKIYLTRIHKTQLANKQDQIKIQNPIKQYQIKQPILLNNSSHPHPHFMHKQNNQIQQHPNDLNYDQSWNLGYFMKNSYQNYMQRSNPLGNSKEINNKITNNINTNTINHNFDSFINQIPIYCPQQRIQQFDTRNINVHQTSNGKINSNNQNEEFYYDGILSNVWKGQFNKPSIKIMDSFEYNKISSKKLQIVPQQQQSNKQVGQKKEQNDIKNYSQKDQGIDINRLVKQSENILKKQENIFSFIQGIPLYKSDNKSINANINVNTNAINSNTNMINNNPINNEGLEISQMMNNNRIYEVVGVFPFDFSRDYSNNSGVFKFPMFQSVNANFFQSNLCSDLRQREILFNSLGQSLFFKSADYINNMQQQAEQQRKNTLMHSQSYLKSHTQKSRRQLSRHPSHPSHPSHSDNKSINNSQKIDKKNLYETDQKQ